jgi:hypothetical protein
VQRSRLAIPALLVVAFAGCGGGGHRAPAVREPVAAVPCGHPADLAHAPLPQETGVYRAGPLVLAIGEDLAQLPASDLAVPTGSDAIAVVSGQKPVRLTVDPSSVPRFSLQFIAPVSGSPTGAYAVRFPACGARRGSAATVHRFIGGFTVHGTGCVRLTVTPAGGPASTMLIPVGDTLRGCPTQPAAGALAAGAMPYLGVSCPIGHSIACDRVGIGVTLARPATLATVQLAGRTVALSPPPADSPGGNCWLGYLSPAGLRRPVLTDTEDGDHGATLDGDERRERPNDQTTKAPNVRSKTGASSVPIPPAIHARRATPSRRHAPSHRSREPQPPGGVLPLGSEAGVRRMAVEQPTGHRDRQLPRAGAHAEL